ncbi:MAG: wax ester/triacylglycerol synthase family O-acyltransferase [Pseudomonadales bacterium]|nr:wax ester/triacylglycerol synthase family O-acyltransferase [Pseudomonadales bacterium]
MEQLTEMDYSFVQMESNRTPLHITPVMFYDQSTAPGGKVRFRDILRVFERNLHKSAVFRRKLSDHTFGLDTPYWVEDGDFDLEFHVRHIALPQPGDWRQLCILMARLHARPLDMRRPLWEAYVIEGLNGVEHLPPNCFAILLKVHHAAIDGVSAAEILNAIHSLTDEPVPPLVEDDWQPEPEPPALQVWSRAYLNTIRRPVRLVETVGRLVPKMIRASRESEDTGKSADSFRTVFNDRVSSFRVMDAIILDLDEVKGIRQAVAGVTVNDVIVSVVGGGLRKYLQGKGELPQGSLVTAAPINVRAERNSDSRGNQVGIMSIRMYTDIEDPVERLRAVNESVRGSKEYASAVGTTSMMELSQGLWPQVIGAGFKLGTLFARAGDIGLPMHTVVSNVPGPQVPLYLAGARLHMLVGLGPIMDMMGLFHGVISGAGKISITFVSCRELMPDPQTYRECLQEAWDELRAATHTLAPVKRSKRRAGGRGSGARAGKVARPKAKANAKLGPETKSKTKSKSKSKSKAGVGPKTKAKNKTKNKTKARAAAGRKAAAKKRPAN